MEANQLIEQEILSVLKQAQLDNSLFQSSDEIEIRDHFYSTCEELTHKGLSLEESISIARQRFGRIPSEGFKSRNSIVPLFTFLFGVLFTKQAFILYYVARPKLLNPDSINAINHFPYIGEVSLVLHILLIVFFVLTLVALFQIFVLKRIGRLNKLKELLIGFEIVFLILFMIDCFYKTILEPGDLFMFTVLFNLVVFGLSVWYFMIFDRKLKDWTNSFLAIN